MPAPDSCSLGGAFANIRTVYVLGRRHRAGRSALREFRRRRRETFWKEWRDWVVLVGFTAAAALAVWWGDGAFELVFAVVLGAMLMLIAFGWMVGGSVFSLPWLWGALGEQWTEEELDRLGEGWFVEHDLQRERGNWDHIVVGPPGIFLLDSKHFHEPAAVEGDALVVGRARYEGRLFRGAAVGLGEELERRVPEQRRPWVQAVAVVWGEFPRQPHEGDRVAYVNGYDLADWLLRQPERMPRERRRAYCDAISALARS
jgi:hypothetical protein